MNCKQGDLAVIVRLRGASLYGLRMGSIVTCIKPDVHPSGDPAWVISEEVGIRDACLRPIRDQPGEDETIKWAGLPGDIEIPTREQEHV